jgi:arabinan endo-1,5-alpha-L-arabinosidase
MFAGTGRPIPDQDTAQVSTNWPAGTFAPRMGTYLCQAQQKWTFAAVTNAGGVLGSPYFRIAVANTDRTLAATADGELAVVPAFTGAPEQLWRVDQLPDGTWRLQPKAIPGRGDAFALSAVGASFATLSKFEAVAAKHRWILTAP